MRFGIPVSIALVAAGSGWSAPALASDYGCQVLLCLSNPGGPTQYGACVPPIYKLWRDLATGKAFPPCRRRRRLQNHNPRQTGQPELSRRDDFQRWPSADLFARRYRWDRRHARRRCVGTSRGPAAMILALARRLGACAAMLTRHRPGGNCLDRQRGVFLRHACNQREPPWALPSPDARGGGSDCHPMDKRRLFRRPWNRTNQLRESGLDRPVCDDGFRCVQQLGGGREGPHCELRSSVARLSGARGDQPDIQPLQQWQHDGRVQEQLRQPGLEGGREAGAHR